MVVLGRGAVSYERGTPVLCVPYWTTVDPDTLLLGGALGPTTAQYANMRHVAVSIQGLYSMPIAAPFTPPHQTTHAYMGHVPRLPFTLRSRGVVSPQTHRTTQVEAVDLAGNFDRKSGERVGLYDVFVPGNS